MVLNAAYLLPAMELSLQLASALERIATEQGIAAVDLAAVWFVD
jgi:hypothetical protein